jgi:hypothetical protein
MSPNAGLQTVFRERDKEGGAAPTPQLVVRGAELFGDGAAATAVPVEQLHNPGWLAELRRTPQRAQVGYRVEHPDAPLRRDGVQGPLHEASLGRDPAEREADLIDEADAAHAIDGT